MSYLGQTQDFKAAKVAENSLLSLFHPNRTGKILKAIISTKKQL